MEQEFDLDHGYSYDSAPLRRDSDDVVIGTAFFFEDEPLAVGRDFSGEHPEFAFFEYRSGMVAQELDHSIVKAVADDDTQPITQAVFFNRESTPEDWATFWERLHWKDEPL